MNKYRIEEKYETNSFGYKCIKYFIQKRVFYFIWCDIEKHDSYLSAANHVDILRTNEIFDEDD